MDGADLHTLVPSWLHRDIPKAASGDISWLRQFMSAKPQRIKQERVWPEHWGITRCQILDLLEHLREEPSWHSTDNMYTFVNDFVIPWTQGTGISYALHMNQDDPKEVNVLVSHAWGENVEDFFETLLRSTEDSDVLFVCALSLYQADDAAGPSIEEQLGHHPFESPFRQILTNIRLRGRSAGWRSRWHSWLSVLWVFLAYLALVIALLPIIVWDCVPLATRCAAWDEKRKWYWRALPVWPAWTLLPLLLLGSAVAARLWFPRVTYSGRMLVVPNHQVDIYSRLWCVYEIFVAKSLGIKVKLATTMAMAGRVSSKHATCSRAEDDARIRQEIEAQASYSQIDSAVSHACTRKWRQSAFRAMLLGPALMYFEVVFAISFGRKPSPWNELLLNAKDLGRYLDMAILLVSLFVAGLLTHLSLFSLFVQAQGSPRSRAVFAKFVPMFLVSVALLAGSLVLALGGHSSRWLAAAFMSGAVVFVHAFGLLLHWLFVMLLGKVCTPEVFAGFYFAFCSTLFTLLLAARWPAGDAVMGSPRLYRMVVSTLVGVFGCLCLPAFLCMAMFKMWGLSYASSKGLEDGSCSDGSTADSSDDKSSEASPRSQLLHSAHREQA